MKFSSKLGYWSLYASFSMIAQLPFWVLYGVLLNIIYFVLYVVFRYRVKVVRENLSNSFPEKTASELARIEKGFYKHLAEVMVDTIQLCGLSRRKALKRIKFLNQEEAMEKIGDRNWIAALAHYGSWEYFCAYPMFTTKQVVGVYRPLHSKAFDMYYNRARSRLGLLPVSMNDLMRYIIRNKDSERGFALGLLADQTPPRGQIDYWYDFLNQPTPFFFGIEKTARKFDLPVVFIKMNKVSKAHYECTMDVLWDGKEELSEREIMKRYIDRLEQMIVEAPQYWMWSHKRWKHKPKK